MSLLLTFGLGSLPPAPPTPPGDSTDLVSAIVALFNATDALVAAFPGGIVNGTAEPGVEYPFCQIESEDDVEPGLSLEDTSVEITFVVFANDLDTAKTLGKLLIDTFDSPNVNANSTRSRLVWDTGTETMANRESSKPRRLKREGPGGLPIWRFDIPYTFWCNSTPP